MEKYLNSPIKELISRFPKLADILNEYNIGCVPCSVGSCLLKDVVGIHNLPEDEEQELMGRIAGVVYPDKDIRIPKIARKNRVSKELKYSPPIKRLVDEHILIKKFLALVPWIIENMDLKSDKWRRLILDGADFIRGYADKYHHAKEEDILFKYFDENLDIIKTMLADHKTGRDHVKALIEAVEKQDPKRLAEHLNGYKELLAEHIKKEDEILYPWIDRGLSVTQVGGLFAKFNDADEKQGKGVQERYEKFVMKAERIAKGKNQKF